MPRMDALAVCEAFGLGAPTADPEPVASGLMGTVWHLATDTDRYAIKVIWDPPDEQSAALTDDFARTLIHRGVPAPQPLRCVAGTVLAQVGGQTLRVSKWCELREVDHERQLADVGRLLALMHADPVAAPGPVDPWFTDPVPHQRWDDVARAMRRRRAPFADEFAASVPQFLALQPLFRAPRAPQMCHRDLWPDNLKATTSTAEGAALCVIDWDNAGAAEASQELAMVLVGFWRGDAARAACIYRAYRAAGGPGRVREPGDFTMTLAQFGHFALAAAERWMNCDDPDRAALYEAWFRQGWDEPFAMPEIKAILAALG